MNARDLLRGRELDLAHLIVTHWGYLRSESRELQGVAGMFFHEADELLNPLFGSPAEAHRAVVDALAAPPPESEEEKRP